jgi:light-regulated signal transduction histidine kinase (bacteriophytochrome)
MYRDISEQLTQCDKEPIQYIAAIQPAGTLVVTDPEGVIQFAAVGPGFDKTSSDLLGRKLDVMLGDDTKRVMHAVEERSEPTIPILFRSKSLGLWLTCIGHKQGDLRIFEFELSPLREVNIPSVKFMNAKHDSLETYLSFIVENMQMVTGYDRVMIYRFATDWHGEVVAESLVANKPAFFGHHFPASDIPLPARELFAKLWARTISDVGAVDIPVLGVAGKNANTLDLSRSVLRASSAIHIEYLRNMGISASLTLSIMCDGKLWGLIACHHFSPKRLVAEERSVYSLLAKLISSRITAFSLSQSMAASQRISEFTMAIEGQLEDGQLEETIRDHKHDLLKFLQCDAFSFVGDSAVTTDGHGPSVLEAKTLAKELDSAGKEFVRTESLNKDFPELAQMSFSGVLGVKIEKNWLFWTRKEIVHSIVWAGNPHKAGGGGGFRGGADGGGGGDSDNYGSGDKKERLTPRLSFDAWSEIVRGTSTSWQQHEVDAAEKLKQTILQALGKSNERRSGANKFQLELGVEIAHDVAELTQNFKGLNLDAI